MLLCFVSYLTMHSNSSYTVRTPTHLSVDLFKSVCGAKSPITIIIHWAVDLEYCTYAIDRSFILT